MKIKNKEPYIYKNKKKYTVRKSINGKMKSFKSFSSLEDAVKYRDILIRNNWIEPENVIFEKNQKKYYVRLTTDIDKRWFRVKHKSNRYLDKTKNIYEALYYRDLYSEYEGDLKDIPRIKDCDLITDNPYLDNLKYPIPSRLKLNPHDSKRGKGSIFKKSVSCYSVSYSGKSYCTCRTYEQAHYVRNALVEANWNIEEVPRILDEYPIWYTKLLQFYIYISRTGDDNKRKWLLTIPKDKSDDGKIQHIYYSRLEDALYERDFLVKYDWDYDLLVTNIDDNLNPYYDMELPPYPERKIRNISPRTNHDEDFKKLMILIKENPYITVKELAGSINITGTTLRNWFHQYNTTPTEFRSLVLEGKNPFDYIKQEELIYQPDLSKSLHSNYKGYVHYKPDRYSKFAVSKNDVYYGAYFTREIANKVVKELMKVNWDKSKLPSIKKKLNITPRKTENEYKFIYKSRPNVDSWQIRKKIKGKNYGFGVYYDKEFAKLVRDILIGLDWKCTDLNKLKSFATYVVECKKRYYNNMFGGVRE